MKTRIIFPILFVGTIAFSQQKEIENALTLAKDNKISEATTALNTIANQVQTNYNTLEPTTLADYYFALGKVALAHGNTKEAAEHFAKVNDLETKPYYQIKNKDTKAISYVYNATEATQLEAGNNSVKEKKTTIVYAEEIKGLLASSLQNLIKEANTEFDAQNFANAATLYETIYYINKSLGKDDLKTLYFAGKVFQNAKEHEKAFAIYDKLINTKYNGVGEEYEITTADGQIFTTSNKQEADLYKLNSKYNVNKIITENIEKELITNASNNAAIAKKHDKAIEYCKNYLKDHTGDADITKTLSSIYIDGKKYDEYIAFAQELINANPNDAEVYKYVGLVYNEKGEPAKAKEYFDKSINLNPNDVKTYISVILGILDKEKPLVNEMNNLGNSKADNEKYQKLLDQRKEIYKEAMPYAEAASRVDPANNDIKNIIIKMKKLLAR